nr:hypothetical protein [Providencia alcalifaciens]
MDNINNIAYIHLRRVSITDQQSKTTEFARAANNVKNDSQAYPKVITDKKATHKEDLHNKANALISSISDTVLTKKNFSTQHLNTNDLPIGQNIKTEITMLRKTIKELQNLS